MALTDTDVVAAASRILDSYGLADLTMRRVADELGVRAGALYYHVPNKQTLLARVADEVLNGLTQPEECEVEAWVSAWARQLRAALLSRRDGAELVASALATGLLATDPAEPVAAQLERGGLAPARAGATARALLHFVLGHAFQEQSRSQLLALGVITDAPRLDAAFDAGVAAFAATH